MNNGGEENEKVEPNSSGSRWRVFGELHVNVAVAAAATAAAETHPTHLTIGN